jgi:hypothetical protein
MNDGPDDDEEMKDICREAQVPETKPGAKQRRDVKATDVRPIRDNPLRLYNNDMP